MLKTSKGICVFGHCRSGTTSLFLSFVSHPFLNNHLEEPFRKNNSPESYWKQTKHRRRSMFYCTGVIRHHVQHPHFYEIVDNFNVVTIYRRNILQTAISDILANKTRLWVSCDDFSKNYYKSKIKSLGEISLFEVEKYIDSYRKSVEEIKQKQSFGIVNLVYEDFYLKSSFEDRVSQVSKILEISGLDAFVYPEMKRRLVYNKYNKHNTSETYCLVKNIEQIEKEFSGKDNGSLELT